MTWDNNHEHNHAGDSEFDPEFLLVLAKAGDGAALGRLLEALPQLRGALGSASGGTAAQE